MRSDCAGANPSGSDCGGDGSCGGDRLSLDPEREEEQLALDEPEEELSLLEESELLWLELERSPPVEGERLRRGVGGSRRRRLFFGFGEVGSLRGDGDSRPPFVGLLGSGAFVDLLGPVARGGGGVAVVCFLGAGRSARVLGLRGRRGSAWALRQGGGALSHLARRRGPRSLARRRGHFRCSRRGLNRRRKRDRR